MMRVFIVAVSPLTRAGLESLLVARGVLVTGSSASLESLAEQIVDSEPDVVLLEISRDNAEEILDALIQSELVSEVAVVVLMDEVPPGWVAQALRAGVRGILPAEVPPDQLIAALGAAASGLLTVHRGELASVLPEAPVALRPQDELAEPLTPREREVLQMLASGIVNKQIAERLSISEHTVKFHVASILGKLGASTRTQAVSLGIRHGLVLL